MRMKIYVRKQAQQDMRLTAFAHDIRTPMCCVTGAAQMAMLRSSQGRDVSGEMEQILLAVRSMDRMLSQLCDGQERSARTRFHRDMLTRELLAVAGEKAREKDQLLSVDLTALGDRVYVADYAALIRILQNLLSNAMKYTQTGGKICLNASIDEANGIYASFTVSDNGMGMKPAFMKRLFDPFERAAESAHLPGKGLGLAVVRQMTQRMGGVVSVRSEWGKGTEFTVRVPLGVQVG